MLDVGSRIGLLVIAGALLYAAFKLHKSNKGKTAGVIVGFIAGLALLGTIASDWFASVMNLGGALAVAGLIIAAIVFIVDVAMDKKPDRPALIAAILLPALLIYGAPQFGALPDLIGSGASRVEASIDGQ